MSRTVNFHQLELIAVDGESRFFVDVFALDGGRGHGSGGGTTGRDKSIKVDKVFFNFLALPPFGKK